MVEVLGVVELYFVVCFLIYIVTLTAVRNSDKEEKKLRVQEREKKIKTTKTEETEKFYSNVNHKSRFSEI